MKNCVPYHQVSSGYATVKHMRKHHNVVVEDTLFLIFKLLHIFQNTGVCFELLIESS